MRRSPTTLRWEGSNKSGPSWPATPSPWRRLRADGRSARCCWTPSTIAETCLAWSWCRARSSSERSPRLADLLAQALNHVLHGSAALRLLGHSLDGGHHPRGPLANALLGIRGDQLVDAEEFRVGIDVLVTDLRHEGGGEGIGILTADGVLLVEGALHLDVWELREGAEGVDAEKQRGHGGSLDLRLETRRHRLGRNSGRPGRGIKGGNLIDHGGDPCVRHGVEAVPDVLVPGEIVLCQAQADRREHVLEGLGEVRVARSGAGRREHVHVAPVRGAELRALRSREGQGERRRERATETVAGEDQRLRTGRAQR